MLGVNEFAGLFGLDRQLLLPSDPRFWAVSAITILKIIIEMMEAVEKKDGAQVTKGLIIAEQNVKICSGLLLK